MPLAISPVSDFGVWARSSGLEIVLFLIGTVLLTRLATWFGARITDRIDANAHDPDSLVRSEASKHRHAVAQVVTWTTLVLIYCLAAVLIVQRFGVPLSGLVAPATVAGVALGFGAQRIVQDVLAGFFLIAERQYGFGDVIKLAIPGLPAAVSGTVEEVNLRITRIRTLDGEVIITPNGQISQVTNLSRDWARAIVDIPVAGSVDLTRVTGILRQVGEDAYADDELKALMLDTPSVMGVESLEVDQFHVRMVARTLPGKQFEVSRALRARIRTAFLHEGIGLPPLESAAGEPTAAS